MEIKKNIVIDASPEVVFQSYHLSKLIDKLVSRQCHFDGRSEEMSVQLQKRKTEDPTEMPFQKAQSRSLFQIKNYHIPGKHKDIPAFPETTVTWELEDIDGNKTRVELSSLRLYRKRRTKLSFTEHDKGWTYFLDRL